MGLRQKKPVACTSRHESLSSPLVAVMFHGSEAQAFTDANIPGRNMSICTHNIPPPNSCIQRGAYGGVVDTKPAVFRRTSKKIVSITSFFFHFSLFPRMGIDYFIVCSMFMFLFYVRYSWEVTQKLLHVLLPIRSYTIAK